MSIQFQRSRSFFLEISTVGLLLGATATPSLGYGFYEFGNGRADYANRYDLAGTLWPNPGGNPVIYDFGNIGGFAADPNLPAFFQNAANVSTAVINAGNAWEPWANVNFGNALGATGAGLVRLRFDNTIGNTAFTSGFQSNVANNFAEIVFGPQAGGGVDWNADNFQWTMFHELGHVLGLRDLYDDGFAPLAEEFVDHPVEGNSVPDRTGSAYSDNVMSQNRFDGVDYSRPSQTIVDNDEVAGVTWLWGSKYNQIVTGDLPTSWNGARRGAEEHHGDQNNPLSWWDYRGSVVKSDGNKPYIDVEFPGYQQFFGSLYPNAPVIYGGNQGGSIERFIIDQAGWVGNFELFLKSQYTEERRVRAWVNGGGREDKFVLPINTRGRVFDGNNSWPVVFSPTGDLRKDFGDAPESYKTLLQDDGPRYDEGDNQRLGLLWDEEPDGQPTPLANGDDVNLWGIANPAPVDDEDGVIFGDSWVDVIFNISRPGENKYQLRAWWDVNENGLFDHATELFIDDLLNLTPGNFIKRYLLGFNPKDYYSRFRLTWDPLDLDVKPFGEYFSTDCNATDAAAGNCISHGEVEDYAPVPEPNSVLALFAVGGLGLRKIRKKLS